MEGVKEIQGAGPGGPTWFRHALPTAQTYLKRGCMRPCSKSGSQHRGSQQIRARPLFSKTLARSSPTSLLHPSSESLAFMLTSPGLGHVIALSGDTEVQTVVSQGYLRSYQSNGTQ